MTRLGDTWRKVHGMITSRPTNFSWFIDKKLAGSGLPTSYDEIEWLKLNSIKAILTVREEPLPSEWVDGLKYMYIYTLDLMAPSLDNIDKGVEFVDKMIKDDNPILIHCAAGKGRTGLMLAAYLIKYNRLDVNDAMNKVRALRPGSIQSIYQEEALKMYYTYLYKNI